MPLAISWSLKHTSVNSAALRALGCRRRQTRGNRGHGHFRPLGSLAYRISTRTRGTGRPKRCSDSCAACEDASALLLAVPEYAFGIPGVFKNAIDWTVGSGSLYGKPAALIDVAPPGRGLHVRQALDHVLTAIGVDAVHHTVPIGTNER